MSEFKFSRNLNKKKENEQDPDYVPKSTRDKNFPGMKRKVKLGRTKNPPVKYSDLRPIEGKPKANLTQAQLKRFNKTMQLREGETKEQWEYRTRNLRVRSDEEVSKLAKTHKLNIKKIKNEKKNITQQNKYLRVGRAEREFDFMKFYGLVASFYSVKYGIRKDYFEIGFYFFDNIPFTKKKFENACVLNTGTASGKFSIFLKNGYIQQTNVIERKYGEKTISKPTDLYQLSSSFVIKLTYIYRVLGRMNTLRMYHEKAITPLDDESRQMIHEMNLEIMEIQKGKKPQSKLEE